jgi:hypothetical protein
MEFAISQKLTTTLYADLMNWPFEQDQLGERTNGQTHVVKVAVPEVASVPACSDCKYSEELILPLPVRYYHKDKSASFRSRES